jgi:hypothetical protein
LYQNRENKSKKNSGAKLFEKEERFSLIFRGAKLFERNVENGVSKSALFD